MSGFPQRYVLDNADKRLPQWLRDFDVYERHLERFRNTRPVVMEIGVAGGGRDGPEYGGELRHESSSIEFAKHKHEHQLDEINAFHAKSALPVTPSPRSTDCIACHDSGVEFERRLQAQRCAPITRAM